jgi:hypothetical protein
VVLFGAVAGTSPYGRQVPGQMVVEYAICAADWWEAVMITTDVRDLICAERPEWVSFVPVRLMGRRIEVIVLHVADEQARRSSCGLGAIEDSVLLRALFDLPVGVPVPSRRLSQWDRSVLKRSPGGALEATRDTVTRLASPAVKVEMAVVRARNWELGLYWASQFGPFCRRALVLSSMPAASRDCERLVVEAAMFGIGIVAAPHAGEGWLVPPASFRPKQASSGQWLFQERAYAALLESGHLQR